MKKTVVLMLFTALMTSISCTAQESKQTSSKTDAIEVYYFHFTRRCATCNAVEEESLKAIKELYATQYKNGVITFTSVNLDEEEGKAIGEKCKASGQSLLVIKGDSKTDLTSQGFMYAKSNPEKLQAAIKKTIDPLL